MNVTFTKDYHDPKSGQSHKANEQAEVADEQARKLIQEGAARETSGSQQQSGQHQSGQKNPSGR